MESNTRLVVILILLFTYCDSSVSYAFEVNVRKLNDSNYIDDLLNLPQNEKEIRIVSKLSNTVSVKDFCTQASAYVFFKESNFENNLASIWAQLKLPSELWRKSVFISYLRNFHSSNCANNSSNYLTISYQNLLADLKSNNLDFINSIITQSISRIQKMPQMSDFYKTIFISVLSEQG